MTETRIIGVEGANHLRKISSVSNFVMTPAYNWEIIFERSSRGRFLLSACYKKRHSYGGGEKTKTKPQALKVAKCIVEVVFVLCAVWCAECKWGRGATCLESCHSSGVGVDFDREIPVVAARSMIWDVGVGLGPGITIPKRIANPGTLEIQSRDWLKTGNISLFILIQ